MVRVVFIVVNRHSFSCQRLFSLVKNIQDCIAVSVLDVIVDGQTDALNSVFQVGLGHGAIVYINSRTAGCLLQGGEVPHGVGIGQHHLGLLPHHTVPDGLLGLLHEHGLSGGMKAGIKVPIIRLSLTDVLEVAAGLGHPSTKVSANLPWLVSVRVPTFPISSTLIFLPSAVSPWERKVRKKGV